MSKKEIDAAWRIIVMCEILKLDPIITVGALEAMNNRDLIKQYKCSMVGML